MKILLGSSCHKYLDLEKIDCIVECGYGYFFHGRQPPVKELENYVSSYLIIYKKNNSGYVFEHYVYIYPCEWQQFIDDIEYYNIKLVTYNQVIDKYDWKKHAKLYHW